MSPGISRVTSMKTDIAGTIHMLLEDDTEVAGGKTRSEGFYTQSTDDGKTFSKPTKISVNSLGSIDSSMTLDQAGNIFIAWCSGKSLDQGNAIYLSKSIDGGKTF